MTTIQTTQMQPGGYPPQQQGYPPQQQGYPPQQQGYPPQTGYPTQPQQTTVVQAVPQVNAGGAPPSRYNKKAGLTTGVLQIIAGGILIVLGIVLIVLGSVHSVVGWNFWGSICFYIVTGILGVVSKNQSKCVIIAYMVMCIISATVAGLQMIYDASAAGTTRLFGDIYCGGCYRTGYPYYYYSCKDTCSRSKAITAMHSLSAITALGEMIIAIVGSAYCCAGCCTSSSPTTQATVVTYAQAPPPGVTAPAGSYPPAAPPAYNQQGTPMQQQPGEETKY